MSVPPSRQDLEPFLEQVALPPSWRVVYEPVVESTMDLGREAARRGWPDRSVFVCDFQTAGRGRRGRQWAAPPGQGLLFTLLLAWRDQPQLCTMLASVALCEALERLYQLEPSIKWPNDLLLDGRKLAGVLAEGYSGPSGSFMLVGCGVNANQPDDELAAVGRPAASLRGAAGRPIHRGELLVVVLEQVDAWLALSEPVRADALRRAWTERLWGLGRPLRFREQDVEFTATPEGVDTDGALLVRLETGESRRLLAAEILL